jgi:hypothetical protein
VQLVLPAAFSPFFFTPSIYIYLHVMLQVGVNGRAELRVWVAPSVAVNTRPALIPDYAQEFCRPGFTQLLPKSSGAVGAAGSSSAAGAKGVRGGASGRRDGAGAQQKAAAGSRQGRRS